jgi:divalent metal cation (Fe/Co/Zn/Cd) transporter
MPHDHPAHADDSHRADALTSLVALTSILGSSFGGYTFLDPLGGLAVSFFILQQGLSLSKVAMWELLDAGVDKSTQKKIELLVEGLVDGKELLGVRNVRGVKSGGTSPAPFFSHCAYGQAKLTSILQLRSLQP